MRFSLFFPRRFRAGLAPLALALCLAPMCLASPARAADAPDPVVAKVGPTVIHLSDVEQAAQSLPEQYRNMPQQMLFPALLNQIVDRAAVVLAARKQGLDKDPAVAHAMARAADDALQANYLRRAITPHISDEAVRALYDKEIAGKPGEPEVHARHILVDSEADAQAIIDQLKKGADFAALAKEKSTDKGSADTSGGDLGWFKRGDMVPEFAEAAFAMKAGQVSDKPVKSQFGWHVIQVLETRTAPPPSFEEARGELRNQLIQGEVQKLLASARQGLKIETFNADGTPQRATDGAVPPSGEKPAGAQKAPASKK